MQKQRVASLTSLTLEHINVMPNGSFTLFYIIGKASYDLFPLQVLSFKNLIPGIIVPVETQYCFNGSF